MGAFPWCCGETDLQAHRQEDADIACEHGQDAGANGQIRFHFRPGEEIQLIEDYMKSVFQHGVAAFVPSREEWFQKRLVR